VCRRFGLTILSPFWLSPFWFVAVIVCRRFDGTPVVRLSFQNMVAIRYSSPHILPFYDFASLAEKYLTTPPFGGFERLNIVGSDPNHQKAHA